MSTAVVVGGGISGLVAARQLVLAGHDVTVRESEEWFGGMVRGVELAGITVDSGAEAYATRTTDVADLCAELGLDVAEPASSSHVWWTDRGAFPLARGILGIPGSIDDPAFGVLSAEEKSLASKDLTEPVGDLGDTVADVVTSRLGPAVLQRLVEPLARGVYGTPAAAMPIERFAPGLKSAVAEHGSLLRAVAACAPRGAAVAQPVGGMHKLVEALVEWLTDAGASLQLAARVASLDEVPADRVVLAVPARVASRLLRGRGIRFMPPRTSVTRSLLLAVRHPGLASDPIGSGLLIGHKPESMTARSLTHYSAKWPWARRDGVEVLRVALPPDHEPDLGPVLADVSTLLGLELTVDDVVAHHQATWTEMPKLFTGPDRERLDEQVARLEDISMAGAWLAGNGLAAVVRSAKEAAQ